jgi:hypothetical protein
MRIPSALDEYENEILAWAQGSINDGQAILKRERPYTDFDNAKKFVMGQQFPLRSRAISRITDNRLRKIVMETIAALTDVRPIWNYETFNAQWKPQGEILSKLARAWWKNNQIDRRLQSVLTYGMCGGSAYGYLRWNPDLPGGGDIDMIPLSPRDVVPIDPVFSDSIQDWRGVVVRLNLPTETVKQMYPLKSHKIGKTKSSWFAGGGDMTREGGNLYNVISSAWSTLTRGTEDRTPNPLNSTDLFFVFVKDDAVNTGTGPMFMGRPDSNWSYEVPFLGQELGDGVVAGEDEARLYPRGRLIVLTQDAVCEDGPNPYWHGMFPLVRFTLEPLPWTLLGASIIGDLIPLQNALNEALRGLEDGMAQWIRRGVIGDRASISKASLDAIDTRKAGLRAYLNNNVGGQGFQIVDGPSFPNWYIEMLEYYKNEMDELSGVRGLKELAQMKQMPSADTIEKYMEALSPMLKSRARSVEVSLGEVAEMIKVNFFQYYDKKRRFEIVGQDGVTIEDFDFDPMNMIPASIPGVPPEATRESRAMAHHKNFKFNVAHNSFLEVSHVEQKMLILQLFRANVMDPWSLWEAMDIQNVGVPPAENIEERIMASRQMGLTEGPTPDLVQLQQQLQKVQLMLQLQQLGAPVGPQGAPPGGGAPQMGFPGGPVGRPPSGQQPPQMVQKEGPEGPRTVVSESGR